MCLGIPMRVMELGDGWAVCHGRAETRQVCTLLLGDHALNDWVLVHLDNAMRVLDDVEAQHITDALDAIEVAMAGGNVDHLFADIINREPQLPEALRATQPLKAEPKFV